MATKKQATETVEDKRVDATLYEPPTVEIKGETYRMRRLRVSDSFKIARLLGGGIRVLGDNPKGMTSGMMAQVFVASIAQNEDAAMTFIASMLGIERADLDDPERFPFDSIIDIFRSLAEHEEIRAFFARLEKETEDLDL